ncbi:hypothetical protein L8106_21087 [Lyngbya sp. PCC 8106]|nr:hypothetical protein L8106_21087 [Lyngbya sp. PCC 8106]
MGWIDAVWISAILVDGRMTEKIGVQAPSVIDGFMLNFLLWKG